VDWIAYGNLLVLALKKNKPFPEKFPETVFGGISNSKGIDYRRIEQGS
jgi:hypothetical protein